MGGQARGGVLGGVMWGGMTWGDGRPVGGGPGGGRSVGRAVHPQHQAGTRGGGRPHTVLIYRVYFDRPGPGPGGRRQGGPGAGRPAARGGRVLPVAGGVLPTVGVGEAGRDPLHGGRQRQAALTGEGVRATIRIHRVLYWTPTSKSELRTRAGRIQCVAGGLSSCGAVGGLL